VFSIIKAETVVFDREFGGRFERRKNMAGKLKPLDVARTVASGKYPDGDGLYLIVASSTSRNWSYRYWIKGKERWHGLGSLQDVSLKDARIKRDAARQAVRAGVDIVEQKRSAREEAKAVAVAAASPTFEQCAQRYIDENWSKWSKKHRAQWPSSLKAYAYRSAASNALFAGGIGAAAGIAGAIGKAGLGWATGGASLAVPGLSLTGSGGLY
jgi:hypothetical protein